MLELLILGGIAALVAKGVSSSNSKEKSAGDRASSRAAGPTVDVHDDYAFAYRHVDGSWRAYILSQPNYGNRPDDLHSTHRYRDEKGYFVCWSEPIRSLEQCKVVSRLWARNTDAYIRKGSRF